MVFDPLARLMLEHATDPELCELIVQLDRQSQRLGRIQAARRAELASGEDLPEEIEEAIAADWDEAQRASLELDELALRELRKKNWW